MSYRGWIALLVVLPSAASAGQARVLAAQMPGEDSVTAVVLSGGGSRGLAHAGVLRGLEQRGYDPDVVVGVSIGAIVGALYAAGYTPEEIEREASSYDWGALFTPAPLTVGPDREVRFPVVRFEDRADPLRFNGGIVAQWRVDRALVRLLFDANARSLGDFDRLPRRFRAVATDLQTGKLVVLDHGDLARATRASMAVPGMLAPVEWDGRFLVDGGVADNLPVGVGRKLGADRVIGVDVRTPAAEIRGRSPLQVLSRAIDIMLRNARGAEAPADIEIVPDIPPSLTSLIFPEDPSPLFEIGRRTALRDAPPASDGSKRARSLPSPPQAFGALRIEAPDPALEALARRAFAEIAPGPYDPGAVLAAVDRLYTTGLLDAVWPRVEEAPGQEDPALVVRLEAPPRVWLAGAAGYDSDRGGRIWGTLRRSLSVGRAPGFAGVSASLTPLEQWATIAANLVIPRWPRLSWSGGVHLKETDVRRFAPNRLSDLEVVRAGGWLSAQMQQAIPTKVAIAMLRAEWIATEDGRDGFSAGPLLRVAAPLHSIPVVGVQSQVEAEARWGEIGYMRAEARGSRAIALGPLQMAGVAGISAASEETPLDAQSALGDEHALPGARWGEHRARYSAIGGADLAYALPIDVYLRTRWRLGAAVPEVHRFQDSDPWIAGAELGALWRSPFGSLEATWGVNTEGEQMLSIDLGARF